MAKEPFSRNEARKRVSSILGARGHGAVVVPHANCRMAERRITMLDVEQILMRGTIKNEPEQKNGRWRYCLQFQNMCAAVQFESEVELTVITVWRDHS